VTEDVAIMIVVGGTVMAGQSDIDPDRNSVRTFVAVKHNVKWYFTAFQNSRVQFIGRPGEAHEPTEELGQELSLISRE
jgi:hypothetical protein